MLCTLSSFFYLLTFGRWSTVARGATSRLLQENIASQRVRSPLREQFLSVLPDVVSRRSRYHYGILAKTPIVNLNRDPQDVVTTDPDGVEVTARMNWYLLKVMLSVRRLQVCFIDRSLGSKG